MNMKRYTIEELQIQRESEDHGETFHIMDMEKTSQKNAESAFLDML